MHPSRKGEGGVCGWQPPGAKRGVQGAAPKGWGAEPPKILRGVWGSAAPRGKGGGLGGGAPPKIKHGAHPRPHSSKGSRSDFWPCVFWRPGTPRATNTHTFSGREWLFGLGTPGLQKTTWPKHHFGIPAHSTSSCPTTSGISHSARSGLPVHPAAPLGRALAHPHANTRRRPSSSGPLSKAL